MNLSRFVPTLAIFALISGLITVLYQMRASAMRKLAFRHGFEYKQGDPKVWYLPRGHQPSPRDFRLRGYPVNTVTRMWNVIEGEIHGVRVIIVDSTLSMGIRIGPGGRYSTFIAIKTDENLFRLRDKREKIAHSNGWTALYRLRFWQIPWTLSIRRIEEHLASLLS